jgi:hypothetical protein
VDPAAVGELRLCQPSQLAPRAQVVGHPAQGAPNGGWQN